MAFHTWQIGLDIQNGQLCALGIQRRRNGWQLRHCWQHSLPPDTLINGMLQRADELKAVLCRWRKQLPRYISLRVGFPPQLVLQRYIDLPHQSLSEAERSSYVRAVAKKIFPVELDALTLDYRETQFTPAQLCITATRRDMLEPWLDCFCCCGLLPEVLELTTAALHVLYLSLSLEPTAALVHRLSDHWLWFSPQHTHRSSGWCSQTDIRHYDTLRKRHLKDSTIIYYSATTHDPLPDTAQPLLPLSAISSPLPLTAHQGMFTLAAGLALRPEDH